MLISFFAYRYQLMIFTCFLWWNLMAIYGLTLSTAVLLDKKFWGIWIKLIPQRNAKVQCVVCLALIVHIWVMYFFRLPYVYFLYCFGLLLYGDKKHFLLEDVITRFVLNSYNFNRKFACNRSGRQASLLCCCFVPGASGITWTAIWWTYNWKLYNSSLYVIMYNVAAPPHLNSLHNVVWLIVEINYCFFIVSTTGTISTAAILRGCINSCLLNRVTNFL